MACIAVISDLTPLLLLRIQEPGMAAANVTEQGANWDMMPLNAFMHAGEHALQTMDQCSCMQAPAHLKWQVVNHQSIRQITGAGYYCQGTICSFTALIMCTMRAKLVVDPHLDSCGRRRLSVSMQPLLDLDMPASSPQKLDLSIDAEQWSSKGVPNTITEGNYGS